MNQQDTEHSNAKRAEELKKEQKRIRKTGVMLFFLAVILIPFVSMIHYSLVGIPAVIATIGGFLILRSYAHVKYQNIDQQK